MHILYLARHYPPEVSGGARRPFLMSAALRDRGHRVTVVTPFRDDRDDENDEDRLVVPHPVFGDTPRKHQAPPATGAADRRPSLRDHARQWLLWPDPEIRWCRAAAKSVIASGLRPDWLITTSPPESAHLAGHQIAGHLNIPWLAEFRDTWVTVPHRQILARSPARAFLERRIARHALSRVTALAFVSSVALDEVEAYVKPGTPHITIDHFSAPPPPPMKLPGPDLNLVHTGGFTLSDRRRQIAPLLQAIASVARQKPGLHLHLAGRLTAEEIETAGLAQGYKVSLHGELPLEKTRAMQAGADALILYTPENSHALPGKYAEYRFARRPILYLGSGDWLSLVEDKRGLDPLEAGLPGLTKGEKVAAAHFPDVADAARQLEEFLEKNGSSPKGSLAGSD